VDIYDDDGALLLAEGQAADNEKLAQVLATRRVFINESLAQKWKGLSPSPLKNMLRPATSPAQLGGAQPEPKFRESQFLDTGFAQERPTPP